MQAINEQSHKLFYVLTDDDGQRLCMQSVSLVTRACLRFRCQTEEDFGRILPLVAAGPPPCENLPPELRKPILHVRYAAALPEALDRLAAAAGDAWHLFPEPCCEPVEDVVIDMAASPAGAFDSLLSALGELCPPGSAVYDGVRRLLEARVPRGELDRMFVQWKQRFFEEVIF